MCLQLNEIDELHKQACEEGKNTYIDPETGKHVITEFFLLKRGYCCDFKCRHCPYKKTLPIISE